MSHYPRTFSHIGILVPALDKAVDFYIAADFKLAQLVSAKINFEDRYPITSDMMGQVTVD